MALDERLAGGAFYRFTVAGADSSGSSTASRLSNGLGWSPDGAPCLSTGLADATDRRLDFEPERERSPLHGRLQVEIESEAGILDGLTVDEEGGARGRALGGGAVRRYGPDGRSSRARAATREGDRPCFGGPDGRDLYVTTASISEPEPAGSVFVAAVDVAGLPAQPLKEKKSRRIGPQGSAPSTPRRQGRGSG